MVKSDSSPSSAMSRKQSQPATDFAPELAASIISARSLSNYENCPDCGGKCIQGCC